MRNWIVFATQDSSKLSSWSNVPYLLCETLKRNDVHLIQVTLSENQFLRNLVRACKKIFKWFTGYQTTWDYSRSGLHFWLVQRQMNQTCKKHRHDAVLVISCSYAPSKFVNGPLIQFCDWPYDYYLQYFLARVPDFLERKSIGRERAVIEKADFVFVLFPVVAEYMAKKHSKCNAHYIGNVINAVQEPVISDVLQKTQTKTILFIGKPHYKAGADELIKAFRNLKKTHADVALEIVGMDSALFSQLPPGVTCHGYLDKGDDAQRKIYYDLLRKARLFVNTNPKWASFSAMLEAMYFYTPVITSKYPEMQKTFGEEIDFGVYFTDTNSNLENEIEYFLNDDTFPVKAMNAHQAVQDYTWDKYVKTLLHKVEAANVTRLEHEAT